MTELVSWMDAGQMMIRGPFGWARNWNGLDSWHVYPAWHTGHVLHYLSLASPFDLRGETTTVRYLVSGVVDEK